jgi:hypothetical protein
MKPPHDRQILTDREGRFRVEGLIPAMKFNMNVFFRNEFYLLDDHLKGISVRPGETKDVGVVRARPNPDTE